MMGSFVHDKTCAFMKKVTAVLNEMEAWKKSLSFADDSGFDHDQFYFSAHGLKTVTVLSLQMSSAILLHLKVDLRVLSV